MLGGMIDLETWETVVNGEYQVKDYFRKRNYKVVDVTDKPEYWKQDIDILVTNSKGIIKSFEIKFDGVISTTGNLYLETSCDIDKHKQGWFNYTKADYIVYGDKVNRIYYVIPTDKLRKYVERNKENLRERAANDYCKGEVVKVSLGYLLPVQDLIDNNLIDGIIEF